MGIQNRDYYREGTDYSSGLDGTPVVKYLIIANVVVFLLQIFIVREVRVSPLEELKKHHPERYKNISDDDMDFAQFPSHKVSIVQEWLELDSAKVTQNGQVWRLLTHAFCHDRLGIWHIIINMLCLYWFGSTIESMYGSREFLLFYLTSAVVAGLAFVSLDLYTGSTAPGIGASGAVMAVMMLYTMHFPYEIIYLCWFIPVQMRLAMALFVIWDVHPILLALAGEHHFTGIAHAAHLGGLAFGFLYGHYQWRIASIVDLIPGVSWKRPVRPRPRLAKGAPREREAEADMNRLDQVLEKISQSGQDSLTDEERAILRNASERLKSRTRRNG